MNPLSISGAVSDSDRNRDRKLVPVMRSPADTELTTDLSKQHLWHTMLTSCTMRTGLTFVKNTRHTQIEDENKTPNQHSPKMAREDREIARDNRKLTLTTRLSTGRYTGQVGICTAFAC